MKKILMFAAVAATTLFAACSSEEVLDSGGNGGGKESNTETFMSVNVTFPDLNLTRAADPDNATPEELEVNTVTVFIFNPNGTAAAGNGKQLTVSTDFTPQPNNVWALNETSRIKTTSGPKKIYVAANLPAGFTATQENVLTQTATNFNGVLVPQLTSNGISMMSNLNSVTLAAMENAEDAGEATPAANKISTSIDRMVAKVAVSHATTTTDYTVSGITYSIQEFGVGQDGSAMYPVKRVEGGKLITPFNSRNGAPGLSRMAQVNPSGTTPKNLQHYFYAGENATQNGLRGEAAYTSVRAKMQPEKYWKVEGDVVVEDGAATGTDAYVVSHNNQLFFTDSQAKAVAVAGVLNAENVNLPPASYQVYPGHYCHYYVFLNRKDEATTAGHLELTRNDFINVQVNGVKGIGEPGNPDTGGETPGPDGPPEPEIPVVSIPTNIEVTIDVTPWNYDDPTVILE